MEPFTRYILKLLLHRTETAVADKAAHICGKRMSRCHKDSNRSHGFTVQIDGQIINVDIIDRLGPLEHVPMLLRAEGYVFPFALSAASLVYEQKIAAIFVKEFCGIRKITEAAASVTVT